MTRPIVSEPYIQDLVDNLNFSPLDYRNIQAIYNNKPINKNLELGEPSTVRPIAAIFSDIDEMHLDNMKIISRMLLLNNLGQQNPEDSETQLKGFYMDSESEYVPYYNILRYYTHILTVPRSHLSQINVYGETYKDVFLHLLQPINNPTKYSFNKKTSFKRVIGKQNTKAGYKFITCLRGIFLIESLRRPSEIYNEDLSVISPIKHENIFAGLFVKREDVDYLKNLILEDKKIDFSKLILMYDKSKLAFSRTFLGYFNEVIISSCIQKRIKIVNKKDFSFLQPTNSLSPSTYREAIEVPRRTLEGFNQFIYNEY